MVEVAAPDTIVRSEPTQIAFANWSCCSAAPGSVTDPSQLDAMASEWIPAAVPGTVASALMEAGMWDMNHPPGIDGQDWWYRTEFTIPTDDCDHPSILNFDGLATLAEVWLNGQRLLVTDNMFRSYRLDVSQSLRASNELVLGFRSLSEDLQKKRPRPRWKTNLVNQQQLRWRRTTLLGRIPGWSPPVPTIGPWRDIRLERSAVALADLQIQTRLDDTEGVVTMRAGLHAVTPVDRIAMRVGDCACELDVVSDVEGTRIQGECRIPNAPLWWPHTHGLQTRLPCQIVIESAGTRHDIDCGQLGFRDLKVERADGFAVHVNGQPMYCRGACWTVSNVFTVDGTERSLRRDLTLARDAGVNMLRVIGTMTYESDLFYRLCDELGIMVWQDLMFANMDYPVDDPAFAENIATELSQQLRRLAVHPSVIIYCGNSEIEQQAAMLGMPRELWRNSWFGERAPRLIEQFHSGTEYMPSTPCGGTLPFHPSEGISHYYGVGAYLRSPSELRQANVKFTPECLGFANIPEPQTINLITEGAAAVIHHPKWKQRVPRDTGAGWDFEDVRDHYLKQIYGVDPVQLRSTDMPRYLQLSRLVPGEMMSQTFAEWRCSHSNNRGGLVWFYKDLWPATGWGVVDSTGSPKAAYYALKRVWQNRQITVTDEGLNGLHVHAINETAKPFSGFVEVTLLKEPHLTVVKKEAPIELAARSTQTLNAETILDGFFDATYAYRFGPPHHDVVVTTLYDADHQVVSEAFHFVRRRESNIVPAVVEAFAEKISESEYQVTIRSDRFLHNVRLNAPGFLPHDTDFHLVPQRTRRVCFTATGESNKAFRAELEALNLESAITITPIKTGE